LTESALSALLEGCRRNREPALKAFYEHFHGYALAVCLAYAADRDEALEMMHDGFLKAFRNLPDLREEGALKTWLRRILVNTAIDYHRRRKRQGVILSLSKDETASERVPDTEADALDQLSAEDILAALHRLPELPRVVFGLYVLEGYSHREIAQRLGLAESTSRAYLSEANARLRRLFSTRMSHDSTKR
jgi:RNA polymerase sigma-70 factor (ECF subfamily)